MKLWQKVFCISLVCVILVTGGTTLLVLLNNFRASVRQETDRRISEHSFVVSTITNNVLYERLQRNVLMLDRMKVANNILNLTAEPLIVDGKTLVLSENGNISSDSFEPLSACTDYTDALEASDSEILTYLLDDGNAHYLLTGSRNYIENEPYSIITVADISGIFDSHYSELRNAAIVSFVAAVNAAVIIAILVYRLLPLKRVNAMLQKIANGSYTLKLPERGGYEFRELARNINVMSDSINENVEALKAIADGRKQFVDNFAHEMKTPLTSILGFSDIMRVKKEMPDEERVEYASIIFEETKRLKNLSFKLLELATTENAPLEFEVLYVPDLFAEVRATITPLAAKKGVSFTVQPAGCFIRADRVLFLSLLYNLIDNAIKASEQNGSVALQAATDKGILQITVTDNGVGMHPEQLRHIAEPFYMTDKSRSRKNGGVGLGLSLCAKIAARHSASLSVKSSPRKGTVVTVSLHCQETAGEKGATE